MSSRIPALTVLLSLACLGLAAGCGASAREGGQVEYSVSAVENYEKGIKALDEEEWQDAAKYFGFVKARFPYSKYAVLSDLRIADAAAGAEQYLDAIDTYKQFIRFHPSHELVESGYAAFKIGECYYHMLPDDWFLSPPAYEKDQSAALDAARELSSFVKSYPKSEFTPKAKEMYLAAAHLLAAHEWYVANYYWNHEKPMGAVLRLRTLLKLYPDAGFDEEALWLLGRAYVAAGRPEDAKKSWETLLERFPKNGHAAEATAAISHLKVVPAAAPAPAAAPVSDPKTGG